jgi:hypothetical protein
MENISKHLTYREATYSQTAIKLGIDNKPNESQLKNIIDLAENIFEPLRTGLGDRPIYCKVFRCKLLNENTPGADPDSQHMAFKGAAGDIDNDNVEEGPTNREIFLYIYENLEFDKLIWEYGDDKSPDWIHVSFHKGYNRRDVRRKYSGDSKYYKWKPNIS